jgi:hypothetical protein
MDMTFRYTRHQVARGSRPDADSHEALHLFKNVSYLRLTYQIRRLTYRALTERRRLVIRVPRSCSLDQALRAFQKEHSAALRIERA